MAIHWFRMFEGQPIGPFTREEFVKLVESGQVTAETQVRRSDVETWVRADQVKGLLDAVPTQRPAPPPLPSQDEPARRKEYKVLSQKDKWFSQKFDPARLEEALNAYAEHGWTVKAAVTATIAGLGPSREEMIVILER